MLTPLALSLGLMFACQGAQAQATSAPGEVMTTAAPFEPEASCQSTNTCFKKRWIYYSSNMGNGLYEQDPYYVILNNLITTAKDNGYNGIALASSYLTLLGTPDNPHRNFVDNFKALSLKAKNLGIDLIPVSGGPEIPKYRHPELVEAIPVDRMAFTVNGAVAQADGTSIVTDGTFANGLGGWGLADPISRMTLDTTVGHPSASGETNSVKFISTAGLNGPNYGTARLWHQFGNLKPHTSYRVSFWMKTQNYKNKFTVMVNDPTGVNAIYRNYSSNAGMGWGTQSNGNWNDNPNTFAADQDWTRYDFDINTLNYDGFRLYMGTWSNTMETDGAAWIDDIDIREVGLPHTVRRATLPVKVTALDGTVYTEGTDYRVLAEKLSILSTGRIRNGDKLLVSSYQSGDNFSGRYATPASTCSQTYFDEQKAVFDGINNLFAPSNYFIYYDEWRVMNWDPSCTDATAGAYLARTTTKMQDTVLQTNPNVNMYIWNDMFDPNLNALPKYFAVNGDLTDAWKGLKPNTTIMNWSTMSQRQSLKFFSDKDFRQMIALYYDDSSLASTRTWLTNLQAGEQADGVKGVDGFMYTTWNGNNADLKRVTDLIRTEFPRYWPTVTTTTPSTQ
ncbi:hypothetical protein [Duganella rhizosphaerae]|uniref:hypothetical protein n=1 Tax=Duganella rhizosphaerae TaxID=2885763 RepID=UPI00403F35FF